MSWLISIGAALLWIGVTVQAVVEYKRYRAADPKPSYWYSNFNGWVLVWAGTGTGYAAAAQAKGGVVSVIVSLLVAGAMIVSVSFYLVGTDKPAVGEVAAETARNAVEAIDRPSKVNVPSVLLTLVLLRFLFSKRR